MSVSFFITEIWPLYKRQSLNILSPKVALITSLWERNGLLILTFSNNNARVYKIMYTKSNFRTNCTINFQDCN